MAPSRRRCREPRAPGTRSTRLERVTDREHVAHTDGPLAWQRIRLAVPGAVHADQPHAEPAKDLGGDRPLLQPGPRPAMEIHDRCTIVGTAGHPPDATSIWVDDHTVPFVAHAPESTTRGPGQGLGRGPRRVAASVREVLSKHPRALPPEAPQEEPGSSGPVTTRRRSCPRRERGHQEREDHRVDRELLRLLLTRSSRGHRVGCRRRRSSGTSPPTVRKEWASWSTRSASSISTCRSKSP